MFNNYGAKSTAEWILGYGFVLDQADWNLSNGQKPSPPNPDDLYTLKIAIPQANGPHRGLVHQVFEGVDSSQLYHNLSTQQLIPDKLLAQLRLLVAESEEILETVERWFPGVKSPDSPFVIARLLDYMTCRITWDNELNALDCLKSMLEVQYERLTVFDWTNNEANNWKDVRDPVRKMIQIYMSGEIHWLGVFPRSLSMKGSTES